MINQIKENIFAPYTLVLAAIYGLIVVGAFSSYMFIQIQVSGAEVGVMLPTSTAMKAKLGR